MDKIQIIAPKGATKNKKIRGRGVGSGRGSTSGRGSKGQRSRAGGHVRPGFEGGQMPLYRRIATRGFSNSRFKKVYTIVKIGDLEVFEAGTRVTKEDLIREGIVRKKAYPVKILSGGTLTKKLTVEIDKMSKNAQQVVVSLGGEVFIKEKPKVKDKETGKAKRKAKKKSMDDDEDQENTTADSKEKTTVKGKDKSKNKEKAGEDGE